MVLRWLVFFLQILSAGNQIMYIIFYLRDKMSKVSLNFFYAQKQDYGVKFANFQSSHTLK